MHSNNHAIRKREKNYEILSFKNTSLDFSRTMIVRPFIELIERRSIRGGL